MLPAAPVAPEAETPAPAGLRFGGLRGRNEAAQLRARWEQDAARLARPIDRVNHEPAANDQVDVVLEHGERHPRQAEAPRLVAADVLDD